MPVACERLNMPQPLRWPWMATCAWRRSAVIAGKAHAVDADHDARAAGCDDQVVAAQHLVDFAGDVGGIHRPFAGFLARNSLSTRSTAGTR